MFFEAVGATVSLSFGVTVLNSPNYHNCCSLIDAVGWQVPGSGNQTGSLLRVLFLFLFLFWTCQGPVHNLALQLRVFLSYLHHLFDLMEVHLVC